MTTEQRHVLRLVRDAEPLGTTYADLGVELGIAETDAVVIVSSLVTLGKVRITRATRVRLASREPQP